MLQSDANGCSNLKLCHGTDIVEIARIAETISRWHGRFLQRIFTSGELSASENRIASLSARFAAKEAVMKALGTGWEQGVGWQDIEVVGGNRKSPGIKLYGQAHKKAVELGIETFHLSLSHTSAYAMASAIGVGCNCHAHPGKNDAG